MVKLTVFGRVQRVGFRYFVKRTADKLDLRGWVKNLSDGSVRIVIQGEKEKLEEFLNHLRQGTFLSRVKEIKMEKPEKEEDDFKGFEIKF